MIAVSSKEKERKIFKEEKATIYSLGTLDWNIYEGISDKHVTDEVIITEEQLSHIRSRHPEAYEDILHFIKDVLATPDYIIRDKRKDTGIVIKRIAYKDENILLVLKVCTIANNDKLKNSVISSWKISEDRLNNYLRVE